jgi:hypothetical protein
VGTIVGCAFDDTTSCNGKLQGIENHRQLGQKLKEITARGGEAGLRQE